MPVKQIFFDCDNTLVLSEELAFEACADLVNCLLAKHGIDAKYTDDMLIEQFVGQNFRGMLYLLLKIHNIRIPADEIEACVKSEENAVIAKLQAKLKPCDGACEAVEKVHVDQKYGLAVVSSSAIRRVRASLDKADLSKYFPYEQVYSASTSLPKSTTKPDPAIYLFAMQKLGFKPTECVAVEDSKSGATAACRANIPTIAYVGSYNSGRKQKEIGNLLKKAGCCEIMYDWSEFPAILARLDSQ